MRPILLFLFIALLAIVVLQNLSPSVALTFLGMQTVALPLAVWLVGAVLAGAITTVLVATLIRFLANGRLPRRKARRPSRRPSSTQGEPWTPPPWTGGWTKPLDPEPVDRAGNAPRPSEAAWAAAEDDWENPRPSNEWDDWDDAPRASTAGSRTVIQDVPYREISPPTEPEPTYRERPYETESAYQYRPYEADAAAESAYQYRPYEVVEEPPEADDSAGYQYRPYLDEEPEEEREVWDDWEEEPPAQPTSSPSPEEPPAEPRRPIVEINREPETGYRAGTVYSFSYRRAEPDTPTDNIKAPPDESPKSAAQNSAGEASSDAPAARSAGTATDRPADSAMTDSLDSLSEESTKPGSIYEADFRVVAPPHYPEEEPLAPAEAEDEGDWEEDGDRPVAPYSRSDSRDGGEVWDDESWGDESWGDGADEPVARRGSLDREIWDDWDDDEDEENDDGDTPPRSGGSGRSPEGNPPLRLG
ncbi:hypothetical protein [Thermoleptolyngbya sp. C42_A2020_037]|uniref:hypothetical protein n=1 Tax=Thermoleptolyngbya sp. C42_A2020_037 TaxID=2747799 RepID=UPI0019EA893A|nr:hypothetical protein [Thermoleptolyngbya sp. C42_A2020_037]MBF2086725.1 hypothetical protein [Thermoleptolyngbya sp. C42_A2020_037]